MLGDKTLMCTSFNLFPEPYAKASTFFSLFSLSLSLPLLFWLGRKKELFDNFWALSSAYINKSPSFKRQPRQTWGTEK